MEETSMIQTICIDYQQTTTNGILTIRFNPTTYITFDVDISMNLNHQGAINIMDYDGISVHHPSDASYYTSMAYNILISDIFNHFNQP